MLEHHELKDAIVTDPEDLFNVITMDFTETAKYEALLASEDCRKIYLKDVNELYVYLIRKCGPFLKDYYKKEIESIFSEEITALPETDTTTTIEVQKTWKPSGCTALPETKVEKTRNKNL